MKKYILGTLLMLSLVIFSGVNINQTNAADLTKCSKPRINLDPKGQPGGVTCLSSTKSAVNLPSGMTRCTEVRVRVKDPTGSGYHNEDIKIPVDGHYDYYADADGNDLSLTSSQYQSGHYNPTSYAGGIGPASGQDYNRYYDNVYFYDGGVGDNGLGSANDWNYPSFYDGGLGGDASSEGGGDGYFGGITGGGKKPISDICGALPDLPVAIPPSLNIEVSNPAPLPQSAGTYNFSKNLRLFPPLPVKDPITIGYINPGDGSYGNPHQDITVTEYNTVIAPIDSSIWGSDLPAAPSLSWPVGELFNNLPFWNKPLPYTFQGFTGNNLDYYGTSHFKWYPLNFFTFPDPTSRIPLLPTVPVNISWGSVKGAFEYKFMLKQSNPLGTPPPPGYTADNAPLPIPINSVQTARTYLFSGRPSASYFWSATPLKADGTDLLGPEIIAETTGYTANPFWVVTATSQDMSPKPGGGDYCNIVAGQRYFSDGNALNQCNAGGFNSTIGTQQVWNNTAHEFQALNVSIPDRYFTGYYPGNEYIEWEKIPGAVRYEIQYAISPFTPGTLGYKRSPIPADLPFVDGATFPAAGGQLTQTAYVIGGASCTNCKLNESDDLDPLMAVVTPGANGGLPTISQQPRPGFQYAFGTITPPGSSTGGGVYWRVRGFDSSGNVIRKNLVQSGYGSIPLPRTPYQSAHLNWPRVAGATSYIVDVVEGVEDFAKLPYLTPAEIPLVKATSTTAKISTQPTVVTPKTTNVFKLITNKIKQILKLTPTQTTQSTGTTSETENVFILRRVVSDLNYDAAEVTVTHFKKLLNEARVYIGKLNRSGGVWDYDGGSDDQIAFDAQAKIDTKNFTTFPDSYYPLMISDLTLNSSSPATVKTKKDKASLSPNVIELITYFPVIITDKSTGNAKIVALYSPAMPGSFRTQLVFSSNPSLGVTEGNYAFTITKKADTPTGTQYGIKYPLTYATFGPMPAIFPNISLNGKAYTEFDKLLPNQTYYWRVRALIDPQISNPGSTANITFPNSWSTTNSFTTPTGVPVSSINVGSLMEFQDPFTSSRGLATTTTSLRLAPSVSKIKFPKIPDGTIIKVKVDGGSEKSYVVKNESISLFLDSTKEHKVEATTKGRTGTLKLTVPVKAKTAPAISAPAPKPVVKIEPPVAKPVQKGVVGRITDWFKKLIKR